MATDPDKDLVDLINAQVGALTKGTNLFFGKVRAADGVMPEQAVFCLATGGRGREAYADGTSIERNWSDVQVTIRSNPQEFDNGQTLARAVLNAVHHSTIAGYINITALESEPNYITEDEDGLHSWTVNVEMWHEE